jgi:type IV fimbrial biogenesis protein FimT
MASRRLHKGYSLYELVMTVTLVSILLVVGVPSFQNSTANSRIRVEVDRLFHAIHQARQESVGRRRAMTICPTQDGESCDPSGSWQSSWMLFVNTDRDMPAIRDAGESIVRRAKIDPRIRISANRPSFSLRSTELRATNGTFIICDRRGHGRARALIVSYTGRPRVAYKSSRGEPISCVD